MQAPLDGQQVPEVPPGQQVPLVPLDWSLVPFQDGPHAHQGPLDGLHVLFQALLDGQQALLDRPLDGQQVP